MRRLLRVTPTAPRSWDSTQLRRYHSRIKSCRRRCGSTTPGWLITRRTLEADELGGFAVPPRTDVFISPYLLHRHPEFWSEAEDFRPERFAGLDVEERHKFSYIPFVVGPRHCIGENMAMFEMLVHVAHMTQRFRMTRADDKPIELEAQINLRPRFDLMMTVQERR